MRHLERLDGDRFAAALPGILAAVVEAETGADLDRVERELASGSMQAWRGINGIAGYVVTHTAAVKDTEIRAMWIGWVAGRVFHQLRPTLRVVADELADRAREAGAERLRIEGRVAAWLRLLPGFERIAPGVLERVL